MIRNILFDMGGVLMEFDPPAFVARLGLGEAEARTVAIEVGMQNSGMAGALSVKVLNSAMAALPANIFSIWMNFSGSVLASWWRHTGKDGLRA